MLNSRVHYIEMSSLFYGLRDISLKDMSESVNRNTSKCIRELKDGYTYTYPYVPQMRASTKLEKGSCSFFIEDDLFVNDLPTFSRSFQSLVFNNFIPDNYSMFVPAI